MTFISQNVISFRIEFNYQLLNYHFFVISNVFKAASFARNGFESRTHARIFVYLLPPFS